MQNGQPTLDYRMVAECFYKMSSSYSQSADVANSPNQKDRLKRLERIVNVLVNGLEGKIGPIENHAVQFNFTLSEIARKNNISEVTLRHTIDSIRAHMSRTLEIEDRIKYKFKTT